MVFKDILNDLINGLFTQDSVNSIVGTLYPELANTVNEQLGGTMGTIASLFGITPAAMGLNVFPEDLADQINTSKYPAVRTALKAAGKDWSKVMNEDGDVILDWGFPEGDRDEWIQAMASAFAGVTALLKAAWGNREHTFSRSILLAGINLNVTRNRGYDKAIMPFLEAIGAPGVVSTATFEGYCNNTTINYTVNLNMLRAIFNPLFDWIQVNMANNPLKTILDFLPNMAYAMEFSMFDQGFADLFDTVITIKGSGLASGVNETIYVSDMINPDDLMGGLGIELTSLNDMLGSLINMLANKDRNTDGWVPPVDENGNPIPVDPGAVEIDGTLKEILQGLAENPGDAIAAIVELFNPVKYPNLTLTYPHAELAGLTPPENQIVKVGYSSYWTTERADFVADNLNEFVDSLLKLLGLGSIQELLDKLFGESVYTKKNMTKLAEMLSELLSDDDIGDILDIVAPLLGLDLDSFKNPKLALDFEDGDKDGFVAALVEFLAPVEPLLRVLLVGDDLPLLSLTTIYGYEGYRTGIIPILEALGIEESEILDFETYKAQADEDGANLLLNIINPILSLIDRIYEAPVETLYEILPNIFYFINADLLNVSLINLLQPVCVLLDTVRPIYNVNLGLDVSISEMLADLVAGLDIAGLRVPALPELETFAAGTVTTYQSKAGDAVVGDAVYIEGYSRDFLTILLRFLVQTVFFRDNTEILKAALADATGLDGAGLATVNTMIDALSAYARRPEGTDLVLMVLFYLLSGGNKAIGQMNDFLGGFNAEVKYIFDLFANSDSEFLRDFAEAAAELLRQISGGIFDDGGLASSGLIRFFQRIIEFFKNLLKIFSFIGA